MKSLSDNDVRSALPKINLKKDLSDALGGLADGTSKQPNKTIVELAGDKGDCIFFTGVVEKLGCFGVKASPYLLSRSQQGKNPVTAYTMLVSTETGMPSVLCDATYLTVARTAETTGLAVDFLLDNRSEPMRAAVIGSGQAAKAHLEVQLRDRDWESIYIYSPGLANNKVLRESYESLGEGVVKIADSAAQAVSGADLIMLCTNATSPVISQSDIKVGALITSISTDAKQAHEIAPELLNSIDVYCDYRQTIALKAAEMNIANKTHGWSFDSIVADLPELITNNTIDIDFEKTRFWRSTGLAVEDIAAAHAVSMVA